MLHSLTDRHNRAFRRLPCAITAAIVLITSSARAQVATTQVVQEALHVPIGERIDAHLSRLVPFGFSGAALVSIDGKTILAKGYGNAIDEPASPVTLGTAFPLDSISKHFTAAAILTLQMQGRLSVQDRLDKFFPDLPQEKRGITLHQLLTHTSGLISGTTTYIDPCTRENVLKQVFAAPLQFEPGTFDGYSNLAFSVLAAIVEDVSGGTLDDFMRKHLFDPAGMTRTGLLPARLLEGPVAHRFAEGRDNGGPDARTFPDWNVYGGSGVHSTAGDLLRWRDAMQRDDILSAEAKTVMYAPVLNDYGCGVTIEQTDHGRLLRNHGGSSDGSASAFLRYEDRSATLILLTNRDGEMFGHYGLGRRLEAMLWGAEVPAPPVAKPLSDAFAKSIAGTYRFDNGDEFAISSNGQRLELRGSNQSSVNAFMAVKDAATLNAANDRARVMLDALAADPTSTKLDARLSGHLASVRTAAEGEHGPFLRFEVKASTPDWLESAGAADPQRVMTFVRMTFARGERVFRIHWNGEKVSGLGGESIPVPCDVWCLPADDDDRDAMVIFHMPTGSQSRVRLTRDELGRNERIDAAGGLIAKRVKPTDH